MHLDVVGKDVLIAGGSKGLGRELALMLTAKGSNVSILARTRKNLDETYAEMLVHKQSSQQCLNAYSVDLTDPDQVQNYVDSIAHAPSILFCVAGGTAEEIGFFRDISPAQIKSCMEKNYFSAAFIAHAILKRWLTSPNNTNPLKSPHHIILTASTVALVSIPGYAAYMPTKAATRALADLLRQEVLLYQSQLQINVHCTFPGTILTEAFQQEQMQKPDLCKELEGSDEDTRGLTAKAVAEATFSGLQKGRFFITMDTNTELLLNNMRGPSPRDRPLRDWLMGLVGSLIWPLIRVRFDRKTILSGKNMSAECETESLK